MNAIRNLLKDHEEVYKLFNQFVDAGEEAYKQKQTIAEKAIEEIMENAKKEEEVLFPAFKEKGGEEAEEMVLEGIEEHRVAEFIMNKIKKTQPEDKKFDVRFKVLMEVMKHHFQEEELEVFPKAKKVLEGELNRLGEEMDAVEKRMK
jgi:hemerythrin-like domain-containing protein